MPKYDAFGREIGEDTLAGLGGSDAAPRPAPQPAPTEWSDSAASATFGTPVEDAPAPPPRPQAAAPQATFTIPGTAPGVAVPRRRRGTSGFGCLIALVVLVAIAAGPIIAIVSFVGAADDAIDEVTGVLDGTTTIDTPGIDAEEEPPVPVGITGRSMVREANFAAALKRLRADELGSAALIRLSPDRVWAQLSKGGKLRGATIDYLGDYDPGSASPGGAGSKTTPLAAIDAGAPVRLVRASAERFPALKANRIDYLVAMPDPIEGGQRWLAYYKNGGGYVEGDGRGRIQRRFKP